MSNDAVTRNRTGRKRIVALLLGLGVVAAACGADENIEAASESTAIAPAEEPATEEEATEDEATEDEAMSEDRPVLEVRFEGLESLGDDFDYEVWTIVDGAPVSGGIFDIGDDGSVAIKDADDLHGREGAAVVVVTIEPTVGDDPAPADTHILAGDVGSDGSFTLSIDHPAALGTDFTDASGSFVLATPTNDPDGDELSGVWFLAVPGPEASLDLPTLPAGWAYEGWAVIEGTPLSTGRFLTADGVDDFDGFSGPNDGPNYPGEDFIVNAPDGLTFPTDLTGSTVVISVEPDADNSPAPFALKPLVAEVPAGTGDHENVALAAGPVGLSGTGSIGG